MASKRHVIEVDETTATLLHERATERGLSVAELVAGLAALTEAPVELSPEELAELDRQMAAIDSGEEATFPHEDVARWLETWGTPDYKPFLKPKPV
jgi:predicted transcriptional regulator